MKAMSREREKEHYQFARARPEKKEGVLKPYTDPLKRKANRLSSFFGQFCLLLLLFVRLNLSTFYSLKLNFSYVNVKKLYRKS